LDYAFLRKPNSTKAERIHTLLLLSLVVPLSSAAWAALQWLPSWLTNFFWQIYASLTHLNKSGVASPTQFSHGAIAGSFYVVGLCGVQSFVFAKAASTYPQRAK